MNWITDNNGNKCSVEYFGTEEAAREALASLKDCKDCRNCSRCSRCSRCSECSECSGCSGCSECSRCSRCSGCSRCSELKNATPVEAGATAPNGPPEVPVIEGIHKRILEAVSAPDCSLDMATWHKCETTHCRAGWVVTLAGEQGKSLEKFYGTAHAAFLIYKASDPQLPAYPDFYCTNDAAMADMRRLAEAATP